LKYLCGRFSTIFTHRIGTHLDAVRIMNQPAKEAVRRRGITDLLAAIIVLALVRNTKSTGNGVVLKI